MVGGGGGGGLQDFSVSPGSESTEPELLSLSKSLSAWVPEPEPELDNIFRDLVTIPKADEAHTDLRWADTKN